MDETKNNRKIARSKEDKDRQFQKIIDVGRELFISKGSYGFNTRALAKRLNMSQPNIYTYVKSKRELWIAIRIEDWKKLKNDLESIVNEHEGSYMDLLEKMAIFFLDFIKNDYNRFKMMFLISPPPSKKIGPIEKNYKIINTLEVVKKVIKEAMEVKEIEETNIDYLTYYFVGLLYGIANMEREFRFRMPISEPIEDNPKPEYIEGFRDFVIKRIRNELKPLK